MKQSLVRLGVITLALVALMAPAAYAQGGGATSSLRVAIAFA